MDNMVAKPAEQLKQNPAMIQALMRSQDGQKLIQMLTQGERGSGFQQAVRSASAGNPAQMMQMVQKLMQNPEGAALIDRINRALQNQ